MQKMIWLIADRLERGHCDDVLEVAWSTMWNVTDETPSNCRKFLEIKGMEYFLLCLEVRPHASRGSLRECPYVRRNSPTRRSCCAT